MRHARCYEHTQILYHFQIKTLLAIPYATPRRFYQLIQAATSAVRNLFGGSGGGVDMRSDIVHIYHTSLKCNVCALSVAPGTYNSTLHWRDRFVVCVCVSNVMRNMSASLKPPQCRHK